MAKVPRPTAPRVGITTSIDPNLKVLYAPQPGPQTQIMLAQEFEIFAGGAKGGGKSFAIIGWLMVGNPMVPLDKATPLDLSYINCPDYRALVIRKNLGDLNSWISEAGKIYGMDGTTGMGANYTQNPNEFTFPTGAKIIMGHLDDIRAVEKYFGNVVHRAAVDEAGFIDSPESYLKLKSCVRSNVAGIRPQLLLTGNPGGPLTGFLLERFVEPLDEQGRIIPPNTVMSTKSWNPFLKREVEMTRICIPSKLKDNPKMLETDPLYYNNLMDLSPAMRAAYLDGDWHSLSGPALPDFRPFHREGEPPEACHVIQNDSRATLPWLPVVGACDWGFGHHHAVYGMKKDTNGQFIVHREMVGQNVGSVLLGNRIARLFLPDLERLGRAGMKQSITLWLSPDAFGRRDEIKTQAEGIAQGIGEVLGPTSVHLPELHVERESSDSAYGDKFFAEVEFQEQSGIVLRKMQAGPNSRKAGLEHLREMLRWRRTATVPEEQFNPEIYARLTMESSEKAATYLSAHKRRQPEILPKVLFEAHCVNLIKSIPGLVNNPKDIEDVLKTESLSDDVYDTVRGLLHSENVTQNRKPRQDFVHEHIQRYSGGAPVTFEDKVWMARVAAAEYAKEGEDMAPFRVRAASMAWRQ